MAAFIRRPLVVNHDNGRIGTADAPFEFLPYQLLMVG